MNFVVQVIIFQIFITLWNICLNYFSFILISHEHYSQTKDFSLFSTESQKILLHLNVGKFYTYREKLDYINVLSC